MIRCNTILYLPFSSPHPIDYDAQSNPRFRSHRSIRLSVRLSLHPPVLCFHYCSAFSLMETLVSFTLLPYIMSFKLLPDLARTFFYPSIFPSHLHTSFFLFLPPPSSSSLQFISHNLPSPSYQPAACRRQSVCLSHSAGRASSTSSFPSLPIVFSASPRLLLPSRPPSRVRNHYSQKSSGHLRVFIVSPRRNRRRLHFLFAPRPESCPWVKHMFGAEPTFTRLTLTWLH